MIAVDYFRRISGLNPPLACFLSHVHSDHLAGLETLKSPLLVYLELSNALADIVLVFTAPPLQKSCFFDSKDILID